MVMLFLAHWCPRFHNCTASPRTAPCLVLFSPKGPDRSSPPASPQQCSPWGSEYRMVFRPTACIQLCHQSPNGENNAQKICRCRECSCAWVWATVAHDAARMMSSPFSSDGKTRGKQFVTCHRSITLMLSPATASATVLTSE